MMTWNSPREISKQRVLDVAMAGLKREKSTSVALRIKGAQEACKDNVDRVHSCS